jgi:hypothetical protein
MERQVGFIMRHFNLLIAAILLAAATYIYFQLPPSKIVIATGPEGGFFQTSGEAYKAYLTKHGIEVELRGREDISRLSTRSRIRNRVSTPDSQRRALISRSTSV